MALELRIRELRQGAKLTLADLAGRAGMSIPHLSQVERGIKPLNNRLMVRLADALGVEPHELIGGKDADDLRSLLEILDQLSPQDQMRVESFALALLASQREPGSSS